MMMNTISKLIILGMLVSIIFVVYNDLERHSEVIDNNSDVNIDCSKVHGYIVATCAGNSSVYMGDNIESINSYAVSEGISVNNSGSASYVP